MFEARGKEGVRWNDGKTVRCKISHNKTKLHMQQRKRTEHTHTRERERERETINDAMVKAAPSKSMVNDKPPNQKEKKITSTLWRLTRFTNV